MNSLRIDGGSYTLFGFPINNFGYSISFLRLPLDIHSIITGSYKREATLTGTVGDLFLMPADVGGTLIFFNDLKIIHLGKISAWMGKIPIIGHIVAIPLKLAVSVLYAIGYSLIAINACVILVSSQYSSIQKRQALLDLIASVLQVVVAVLIIVGYTNPVLCPILATVACLMGGVSFLHRWKYPESAPVPISTPPPVGAQGDSAGAVLVPA